MTKIEAPLLKKYKAKPDPSAMAPLAIHPFTEFEARMTSLYSSLADLIAFSLKS